MKPLYSNATRIAFRGKNAFCMGSRFAVKNTKGFKTMQNVGICVIIYVINI